VLTHRNIASLVRVPGPDRQPPEEVRFKRKNP